MLCYLLLLSLSLFLPLFNLIFFHLSLVFFSAVPLPPSFLSRFLFSRGRSIELASRYLPYLVLLFLITLPSLFSSFLSFFLSFFLLFNLLEKISIIKLRSACFFSFLPRQYASFFPLVN
jgi:hypothetical protein